MADKSSCFTKKYYSHFCFCLPVKSGALIITIVWMVSREEECVTDNIYYHSYHTQTALIENDEWRTDFIFNCNSDNWSGINGSVF